MTEAAARARRMTATTKGVREMRWVAVLLLIGGLLAGGLRAVPGYSAGAVLHMYTALDTNEAKLYIPAFERKTGVKVLWVRLSAGEVLTRLRAEANNPQVSLWFGGPSQIFIAAKQYNLLAPYTPVEGRTWLKGQYVDPDHMWTGFYFGAIGFASNKTWFQEHHLPFPTSWQDLLRPELRGKVIMAFPYTSGTSFTALATLVQLMGEEKAFEYVKALDQQIFHYTREGSAPVTEVGLGEGAVGIAFSHDILKKGIAQGYPVAISFPKEGTGYEIGAMALVRGGRELDLAKRFIEFMLSVEGQNLMQQWYRIPLNPAAKVAPGAVTANQVRLINFDAEWAGKNQARLVERWRATTGK
jgi:iron(III) transport system substrate-binding protein